MAKPTHSLARLVLAALIVPTAEASTSPRILHDPLECLPPAGFARIRAEVEPPDARYRVRLFLRASQHPQFYRIDLTRKGTVYEVALPEPTGATSEVVYYLEALADPVPPLRTPEYRVPVEQVAPKCSTATLAGPPGVGVADVPLFPPGFMAPPRAGAEEERSRKGIFLAIGSAAVAGAGVGLLASSEEATTEAPAPTAIPNVPPVASPLPPPPPPASACFELPPAGEVGMPIRMDASCASPRGSIAYEWRLGDGRMKEGRVITPVYSAPGLYTVELRVLRLAPSAAAADEDRTERTIRIHSSAAPTEDPSSPSSPNSDVSISKQGEVSSRVVDGVLFFRIDYTLTVTNIGPNTATNVTVRDRLVDDLTLIAATASLGNCAAVSRDVTCRLGDLPPANQATVELDVAVRPGVPENTVVLNTASVKTDTRDPSALNDEDTEMTVLRRPGTLSTSSIRELDTSFVSTLGTSSAGAPVTASVRANEIYAVVVDDTTSFHHRFRARSETVVVEGAVPGGAEGTWRFEFGPEAGFAPGSLESLEGQLLGREPRAITFRLTGRPGERIRFTYRLLR